MKRKAVDIWLEGADSEQKNKYIRILDRIYGESDNAFTEAENKVCSQVLRMKAIAEKLYDYPMSEPKITGKDLLFVLVKSLPKHVVKINHPLEYASELYEFCKGSYSDLKQAAFYYIRSLVMDKGIFQSYDLALKIEEMVEVEIQKYNVLGGQMLVQFELYQVQWSEAEYQQVF